MIRRHVTWWLRCWSTAPGSSNSGRKTSRQIYRRYVENFHPERGQESFDQAFCKSFGAKEVPEDLNQAHELVVVASQFDATSERIVEYLAEEHEVGINAIFFRVFKDGEREYLARVWLRDPSEVEVEAQAVHEANGTASSMCPTGGDRDWEEARKYGFIGGGGGGSTARRCRC